MPPSATVLDLIRAFNKLETPGTNEVQQLANHLIKNPDDRESWPGNLLYCFFVSSYEHDSFRPFELKALSRIVEGILIQCDGTANEPEPDVPAAPAAPSPKDPLALPDLGGLDQLGLNLAPGFPEMFFAQVQCDCLEWQTVRRKHPLSCPGRLCKHLSRVLHVNIGQGPPISAPLKRLIAWAGETTSALPSQSEWELLVDEPESMIGAFGDGRTFSIFAADDSGKCTHFTYVIADRQWVDNRRPTRIDHPALREFLSRLIAGETGDGRSAT